MKLLFNAAIYTLDDRHPQASSLLLEGDRIVAIDLAPADAPAGTEMLDLGGGYVIPGLTDAHLHLEHFALGLKKIDCETPTRADCLQRVAERARRTPPGEWILGHGWNHNEWPEGLGSAADLDSVAPNHPVFLTSKSLHSAWVNSTGLRLVQVAAATPDPQDGHIGRDAHGQPDGILYENAAWLAENALPEASLAQVVEAILTAQPVLWSLGLTGVHDFDQQRCFQALQILCAAGELGLRVVKSVPLDLLPQAAALGLRSGFGSDRLRIGSVKLFADGALGPQTAAMLQDYEGRPGDRGMLMLDAEELFEHGRLAASSGLSLAVHAIGDRANHQVLNAYQQLRHYERQNGLPALRHRIEHVQLLHPQDIDRLAALEVIASMQPVHALSDMRMADRFWGARSELAYAWRTQLQAGARLAFGSDAPVESPNPFWGLYAALTRRRLDGTPGPQGWYPQQRLALLEALQAYTAGPAYAAGMEHRRGRLAPGFLADLLVLSRDPFACQPDELYALRPQRTMIDGQWVFEA